MISTQNRYWNLAACMLIAASVGACATESAPMPEGNAALDIARFEVDETPTQTTLTALDANGAEVGHVAIVHGTFVPMPEFADDFSTPTVDGRSLDVEIAGERTRWQDAGYEPVMSLPAIPAIHAKLGQFLEDPHVVDVLAKWQIGFESFRPAASTGEVEYAFNNTVVASYNGTSGTGCTNCTSLGTVNSPARTINLCGGSDTAAQAVKIKLTTEWMVLQTCPETSAPFYWDLFRKSCPLTGNVSSCGTSTGACKGCPLVTSAPYSNFLDANSNESDFVNATFTTSNIQGIYHSWYSQCPLC